MEMALRWEYIIGEVLLFWLKCGCPWFAYAFFKGLTTQYTSSPEKVSATNRLICYAKCVGVIAVIGLFASGIFESGGDEGVNVVGVDYNRGAIVFIVLLVPALFGTAAGFDAPCKTEPERSDCEW